MAIEEKIEINAGDGIAEAYLYWPSAAGQWPGVINLTDIMGIRDDNRASAARIADEGYLVLMPNQFYRTHKLPVFTDDTPPRDTPAGMEFRLEIRKPLTPDAVRRDGRAYANFLLNYPHVKGKKFCAAGYCMTGTHVMYIAADQPDTIAAIAAFHGGGLYTDKPESPHRLLSQIKAKQYYGHAKGDPTMTAEQIKGLEAEIRKTGTDAVSETYDAHHGWTHPGPAYNKTESDRAFRNLFATFKAALS